MSKDSSLVSAAGLLKAQRRWTSHGPMCRGLTPTLSDTATAPLCTQTFPQTTSRSSSKMVTLRHFHSQLERSSPQLCMDFQNRCRNELQACCLEFSAVSEVPDSSMGGCPKWR